MRYLITVFISLFGFVAIVSAQTGTWSGNLDIQGTKLPLVFHLDDDGPTMDSPAQGVKGIPIEVERGELGSIKIRVPSIGASYEGLWLVKQIAGNFVQNGASLPLTLTPGENKPNRPQTPKPPFPYSQEEVSFTNGDAVLKGTLVLPEGYSRKTPVLVMVTGSGLQNRDEEIFEHKPFAVIADALARAGIASLRYDDRGFGESKGDIINCTTEDFKNDALAGVELLRKRFDKVGVIGHSEGGTIAFMLGVEQKVDFIVSLAGMVVSGKETLIGQNRFSLESAGMPEETVEAYCKLIADAFDARINGGTMPSAENVDIPDALKRNYLMVWMQIQSQFMRYFLSLDMRPLLGTISVPVLALNGTKDTQVVFEPNLGALRSGLPKNPSNRIESLDGLNHLFQHCTLGTVAEYREIEETISPEVLETIAGWIRTLFDFI